MADVMITDGMKQQVITRLATINSATSILSLINGRPAKVTVDEVLALAERIERWAWRNLLSDQSQEQSADRLTPPKAEKEPSQPLVTSNGNHPHPQQKRMVTRMGAAQARNKSTLSSLSAEPRAMTPTRSKPKSKRG